MTEKESRRSFLKKMALFAAGAMLGGCSRSPEDKRIDEIYEVVRKTSQSGMSLRPCVDQKGDLRTGFGPRISEQDFKEMKLMLSEIGGGGNEYYVGKCDSRVYRGFLEEGPGRNHQFEFEPNSIRSFTKNYIRRIEPEIKQFVPNYDSLPSKAQGLLVQTHIKTDGDLKSYPVMCQMFNKKQFDVPLKDIELKDAINLYDANFSLDRINNERLIVLREIQLEQARLRSVVSNKTR